MLWLINPLALFTLFFVGFSFSTLLKSDLRNFIFENFKYYVIAVLMPMLWFHMGFLLSSGFKFIKYNSKVYIPLTKALLKKKQSLKKAILISFLIGLLFSILNLYVAFVKFGYVPFFTSIRLYELAFGWHPIPLYLYFFSNVSLILSFLYIKVIGFDFIMFFIFVSSIILSLLHGNKSSIIFPIVYAYILSFLLKPKIGFKSIFFFTFITLLAFYYVHSMREGHVISIFEVLDYILNYVAYNYANLILEIKGRENLTWGFVSLFPVFKILYFTFYFDRPPASLFESFKESLLLYDDRFNINTIVGSLYIDFGYLGLTIIPMILGFISGSIYIKFIIKKNFFLLILYTLILFHICISFFLRNLIFLKFVYLSTIIYLIFRFYLKIR